jgi:hypothetical protein
MTLLCNDTATAAFFSHPATSFATMQISITPRSGHYLINLDQKTITANQQLIHSKKQIVAVLSTAEAEITPRSGRPFGALSIRGIICII